MKICQTVQAECMIASAARSDLV